MTFVPAVMESVGLAVQTSFFVTLLRVFTQDDHDDVMNIGSPIVNAQSMCASRCTSRRLLFFADNKTSIHIFLNIYINTF